LLFRGKKAFAYYFCRTSFFLGSMFLLNRLWAINNSYPSRAIVTFTGGLGAQIISTSIYWLLQEEGFAVSADLNYFKQQPSFNKGDHGGGLSVFPWQLDPFEVSKDDFEFSRTKFSRGILIKDGYLKLVLFLKALTNPRVRSRLIQHISILKHHLRDSFQFESSCTSVHIRRGDYVAVASHLVPVDRYLSFLATLDNEDKTLYVLSDSTINQSDTSKFLELGFKSVVFDTGSLQPYVAFSLMYSSSVLVTSNSQFSLCAGLLSEGRVYIPTRWYGALLALQRPAKNCSQQTHSIERALLDCCSFSLWHGIPNCLSTLSVRDIIYKCQ